MGFESFRVELRGGTADHARVDEFVRRLPGAKRDSDAIASRGSTFYTWEDGLHVIEVEVATSPIKVSCRFTLCHPPSVDSALLTLVQELMARLGMEVRICDDVRPEHTRWFSIGQFPEFVEIVSRYVAARRVEWIASFGPAQFPAKAREVYERIILPQCEPVAGDARRPGQSGCLTQQPG
jgi:hypothetical protein